MAKPCWRAMPKPNVEAEKAITDGSQHEAFKTICTALKELPRESQIRTLAAVIVLHDLREALARVLSQERY
jgi:hypothetical protein